MWLRARGGQEQVDEAAKAIEAKGRRALRLTSDVGDRATLQALWDGTVKEFGKVDILINCAGGSSVRLRWIFRRTSGTTSWTRT